MPTTLSDLLSSRFVRLLMVTVATGICLWTIWSAANFGFARLLGKYALVVGNLAAAEKAVRLTPSDANAHFVRAAALSLSNSVSESISELEQAVALRPSDYNLWLQLGLSRDQAQDSAGALAALNEAVRLAPFYALPRWQRGNLLLRMGRHDEAFADLNHAARSNPELTPTVIGLAWALSKGNPDLTEQLAEIKTEKMRLTFARLLAREGKASEALRQLRDVGTVSDDIRRELVEQLLAKSAFWEAFQIWRVTREPVAVNGQAGPLIYDGGFEGSLAFDEGGFGWRVPRSLPATTVSLDSTQPHSGSKSLRIDFQGGADPASELVSQLILVEPSRRYQINFASRSQDIVTGGLPLVVVTDAKGDRRRLGQSAPLGGRGTSDWQVSSLEFSTGATTTAVVVNLQRENCATSPCPIFGSISLDSFSAAQLK